MTRNVLTFTALLLSVLLLMIIVTMTSDGTAGRTVITEDVVVSTGESLTWRDETYEVHGNITVEYLGNLVLHNAVLEMVGEANGSRSLTVEYAGRFRCDNSTIKGSPFTIGMELGGDQMVMTDTICEKVWVSNTTPAVRILESIKMERVTWRDCPNGTGLRTQTALEAIGCTFEDFGNVALWVDGSDFGILIGSRDTSVLDCEFTSSGAVPGDTVGIQYNHRENLLGDYNVTIDSCRFSGLAAGLSGSVNYSRTRLVVTNSTFSSCGYGVVVVGNKGTVHVEGCSATGAATAGFMFHDVDPLEPILDFTATGLNATASSIGIYVRGHVLGYRPRLTRLNITGCDHGVQALGATVYVEDSAVLDCTVCFYSENKARIEVRRTEHTHRSAAIAPTQQAAVVAFSTVNVTSYGWHDGPDITGGLLYLFGDDGVELDRVDMASPAPVELVVWSLTKYNDLGRLWVVPSIRRDGHEFTGLHFSIYNTTPQQVEIIDHLPPVLLDIWPTDGHWFAYDEVDVSGRLLENGSGLGSLLVKIVGGQETTAEVQPDGNWSVVFDPIVDGPLELEIRATDLAGGSTVVMISDLHVDTVIPPIQLDHGYLTLDNGTLLVPANDVVFPGVTEPNCTVNGRVLGFPDDSPRKCNDTVPSADDGRFEVQLCPGAGFHTVLLTVTDRAGNVGATSIEIGMDATPSRIGVNEPMPEWSRWYNMTEVTLRGHVSDDGASEWFKVYVNGVEVDVPGGVLEEKISLAEGENHILIRAEDQAGYVSTKDIRILVDSIPPELRVVSPVDRTFSTKDLRVNLQGEVFDEHLGNLTMNGVRLNHLEGLFTAVLEIEEGENVFVLKATDLAGNTATETMAITRDLTPPDYTFVMDVVGGQLLDIDGSHFATGSGDAPVTITVTFTLMERATITASEGLGQVEGEGEVSIQFELVEGENQVTFTLVDMAGNVAPGLTIDVVLDTTPPLIEVPGSEEPVRTKDTTHWLRGRVEAGSSLTLDGEPLKVNADGTFTTQVDLVKGENVFHLEAVDRVGLETELDVVVVREERKDESPGIGSALAFMALLVTSVISATLSRKMR